MRFSLYSALFLSYLLNIFLQSNLLEDLNGLLAILCLVISFYGAKKLYIVMGIFFILVGTYLFIDLGKSFSQIPAYMTSTVPLITLFYVLPFINSVIVIGRYDQSINKLIKGKVDHLSHLYYRASLVSFLLGSFLNIAMIPMVVSILFKNLRSESKKFRSLFISRVMLRAYALCLVWSPMEVIVAITVDLTHVSYLNYLPWLLFFSIILLLTDWLLGLSYCKRDDTYKDQINVKNDSQIEGIIYRRIFVMIVFLTFFILSIVVMRKWLDLSFLNAVAIVIMPFSMLWATVIRRFKAFLSYSWLNWKRKTNSLQSYMVLFLSVGFFNSIFRETVFIQYFQKPFEHIATIPLLLFIFIQILFLGLSMIGFHPLVTISILGEIAQPLYDVINPSSIGIVLITSGLSTVMAGPYNLTVSLTGNLLNENPYRIAWWNIVFAFVFSSLGTVLALLLL